MGIRLKDITEFTAGLADSANEFLVNTSGNLTRLVSWSTFADWVLKTYEGFLQSGSGAISETMQTMGRRIVWASQYGSGFTTTPGADINAAMTALGANGGIVELPPGSVTLEAQVSIPSNIIIRGRGIGKTNITAKASLNAHGFVNSDSTNGNSNIELRDFTYDGNYANQTTGNGVVITKGTYCYIEIETKNCRGTGQVFSGGSNNRAGPKNISRSNGQAAAGYGLYFFNCDDAQAEGGGIYNDNCIGVVVEANGSGNTALRAKIGPIKAVGNRADFSQSGAGVHFEATSSGDASDGEVIGATCTGGTGVGINNTATNLHICGGVVTDNTKSGVTTSNAVGFLYSGIKMLDNGTGDAAGYKAQMRFDETALSPASNGLVIGCTGSGTVDGLQTRSANGAVTVVGSEFTGTTNNYNLASTSDKVSQFLRGSFTGTLTGCTTSPTGTVNYEVNGDVVTLTFKAAINGTSNDTNPPTITGMPAVIRPTSAQRAQGVMTDNTTNYICWVEIATSGTLTFYVGTGGTATGSGLKGVQQCQVIYRLTA